MENNLKFNSAICTSIEQSERLLSLGLKKETADCHWAYHSVTATRYIVAHPCDGVGECVPAWSLHRLIEMVAADDIPEYMLFLPDAYDEVIAEIESCIKNGWFNEEYLL